MERKKQEYFRHELFYKELKTYGNDCIIMKSVHALDLINSDCFMVIEVIKYYGSWVPDVPDINYHFFKTAEEATEKASQIAYSWEHEDK